MRPTRSTAIIVVALVAVLLASHGPWWARGAPPFQSASAAGAPTVAAEPAPAVAPPVPVTAPVAPPAPVTAPAAPPAPAPPAVTAPSKAPADAIGSLVGANVTVYLRADAVGSTVGGASADLRTLVTRRGAFVRCDDQWFVLRNELQEIWIPRAAIAIVEMRS